MITKTVLVFLPDSPTGNWGHLCAKYSYSHHSEPKMVSLYWPVSDRVELRYIKESISELSNPEPPELRDAGNGCYSLYRGYGNHLNLRISGDNPGQTKAIKVEESPIPCPKVKKGIDTHFNASRGYWEKYLKSQGWVPA